MMDMPDKIYAKETGVEFYDGFGMWNRNPVCDHIGYTRTDLAQSLADALLECVGLVRVYTSDDDAIAKHAINNARAALANYRKGE